MRAHPRRFGREPHVFGGVARWSVPDPDALDDQVALSKAQVQATRSPRSVPPRRFR